MRSLRSTPSHLVAVQERMGWYGADDQTDDGDMVRRFLATTSDGLRFGPLIDGDLVPESPLTALHTMSRALRGAGRHDGGRDGCHGEVRG